MNPSRMEFSIELPPEQDGDGLKLQGRCIADICLNGIFSDLAIYTFAYDDEEKQNRLPIEVAVAPIHLRVKRVSAYGHEFDKLDGGMTASITVSGDVEKLSEFWRRKQEMSVFIVRGPLQQSD